MLCCSRGSSYHHAAILGRAFNQRREWAICLSRSLLADLRGSGVRVRVALCFRRRSSTGPWSRTIARLTDCLRIRYFDQSALVAGRHVRLCCYSGPSKLLRPAMSKRLGKHKVMRQTGSRSHGALRPPAPPRREGPGQRGSKVRRIAEPPGNPSDGNSRTLTRPELEGNNAWISRSKDIQEPSTLDVSSFRAP